ncbi:MAG: lysophospholipid acyltransferase family protein [Gallionellaceae bacterium]|nr:lysophospholipid acyltransferase family protein [Gallionellaceae bacterium]
MNSSLAAGLFNLMARLPLVVLHRLGVVLGWVVYYLSGEYAARLRENLRCAYQNHPSADISKILKENIAETGKGVTELAWVWRRPLSEVLNRVSACHGLEHLQAAHLRGSGVIILTPHLGCFEVIATYVAAQMAMTCLYRSPKLTWLDEIMRNGRQRGNMSLARTDIGGVRTLLKALKRGEVIGLLPDQVPGNGEGEWAEFFGRPAYTMTLVGRLQEATGASILLSYGERLPNGRGYVIHIAPFEPTADMRFTRQINAALEQIIRTCPAQYLWSYNRYKIPAGVHPPGNGKS